MRYLLILFFLFISVCCQNVIEGDIEYSYFNMDSLVNHQVNKLSRLNPKLKKVAYLDEQEETAEEELDSLGWEQELKVFRDANIDKPAYHGSYDIQIGKQDLYSNLLFDEYVAKGGGGLPVKSLKVYYLDNREAVKKIEAVISEENELFQSERNLLMTFENRNDEVILSFYHVEGRQKLLLTDSVSYSIKSTLIF